MVSELNNLINSQAHTDFLNNENNLVDHKILLELKEQVDDVYTKSNISSVEQVSIVSLQSKKKLINNIVNRSHKNPKKKRRNAKTIVPYESLDTIDDFTHKYMTTKLSVEGKARNDYVSVNTMGMVNHKKTRFNKNRKTDTL